MRSRTSSRRLRSRAQRACRRRTLNARNLAALAGYSKQRVALIVNQLFRWRGLQLKRIRMSDIKKSFRPEVAEKAAVI